MTSDLIPLYISAEDNRIAGTVKRKKYYEPIQEPANRKNPRYSIQGIESFLFTYIARPMRDISDIYWRKVDHKPFYLV